MAHRRRYGRARWTLLPSPGIGDAATWRWSLVSRKSTLPPLLSETWSPLTWRCAWQMKDLAHGSYCLQPKSMRYSAATHLSSGRISTPHSIAFVRCTHAAAVSSSDADVCGPCSSRMRLSLTCSTVPTTKATKAIASRISAIQSLWREILGSVTGRARARCLWNQNPCVAASPRSEKRGRRYDGGWVLILL